MTQQQHKRIPSFFYVPRLDGALGGIPIFYVTRGAAFFTRFFFPTLLHWGLLEEGSSRVYCVNKTLDPTDQTPLLNLKKKGTCYRGEREQKKKLDSDPKNWLLPALR